LIVLMEPEIEEVFATVGRVTFVVAFEIAVVA
jgi:hypothetical protein